MKLCGKSSSVVAIICAVAILLSSVWISAGQIELTEKSEAKTLYEQILEEDGFIHGIDYAWLEGGCGRTLSSNDLMSPYNPAYATAYLDEYGDEALYSDFFNLKSLGYNCIGFWGSAYGEGMIFDESGMVTGVKKEYLENVARFMEVAKRADVNICWYIHGHSEASMEYYSGSRHTWDVLSQIYLPTGTEAFCENFVKPVLKVLSKYKDNLALLSIGCEHENEINDTETNQHNYGDRAYYGISEEPMLNYLTRVCDTVQENLTDVAVTVSSNGNTKFIKFYNTLDLDVTGMNRYNANAGLLTVEEYGSVHPMIMTEYGLGKCDTEESFTIGNLTMTERAEENGYEGAFWWMYAPWSSGDGIFTINEPNYTGDNRDFREFAYTMHYHMLDYRDEYHGVETSLDKPAMFYNTGSGTLKWIASRQASTIDIERSADKGKTWTKIVRNQPQSDFATGYACKYEDTTAVVGTEYIYRVIAYDDFGDKAVSESTNAKEAKAPPVNEFPEGSFESGNLDGWTLGAKTTATASKEQPYSGEYSLKFTTIGEWSGMTYNWTPLKAGQQYELTFKYKTSVKSQLAVFVQDSRGTKPEYYTGFPESTTEWKTFTAKFIVGKTGEAYFHIFGIYDYDENGDPVEYFIDDITLKEAE